MAFQPDKSFVLTLTLGMGGKLSFLLDGDKPLAMFEALRTRVGGGVAPVADQAR